MLCLSGFELYSRWVPLGIEIKAPNKSFLELILFILIPKYVKSNAPNHAGTLIIRESYSTSTVENRGLI